MWSYYTESDHSNLSKIMNIKTPPTGFQVSQILGLVNYHQQFIRSYWQLVAPLTDLLMGVAEIKFPWTTQHVKIFKKIKGLWPSLQIILTPKLHKTFVLKTVLIFSYDILSQTEKMVCPMLWFFFLCVCEWSLVYHLSTS